MPAFFTALARVRRGRAIVKQKADHKEREGKE
jgi:hypothetical protein